MVSITGFGCPHCSQNALAYKENGRGAYCMNCGHELSYGELFDAEWPEGDPLDSEMMKREQQAQHDADLEEMCIPAELYRLYSPETTPTEELKQLIAKYKISQNSYVQQKIKEAQIVVDYYEGKEAKPTASKMLHVPTENPLVTFADPALKADRNDISEHFDELLHTEKGGLTAAQIEELLYWLHQWQYEAHGYSRTSETIETIAVKINEMRK